MYIYILIEEEKDFCYNTSSIFLYGQFVALVTQILGLVNYCPRSFLQSKSIIWLCAWCRRKYIEEIERTRA